SAIQAMLMASWPTGRHVAALMDSAWLVASTRPQQALALDEWRRAAIIPEEQVPPPAKPAAFHVQELKKGFTTGAPALGESVAAFADEAGACFDALFSTTKNTLGPLRAREEVMWWTHARYSHTLRKPLRRIDDDGLLLWTCAVELATRSEGLAVEPVCALLVETLH